MSEPCDAAHPENVSVWPGDGAKKLLFLLDAASALEERILRDWIEAKRPEGLDVNDIDAIRIPSSRRARQSRFGPLEPALATVDDPLLAPLRVAWLPAVREGRRAAGLSDLLRMGDPRDPGALRARWILEFSPDRCHVVVAEPAPVSLLRERWRAASGRDVSETMGLDRFVARQAALALDRAERKLRGARYKVPRFLREEILLKPSFQGGLDRLAHEQGQASKKVRKDAARYLKEIAASNSPLMIDVFAQLCRSSSTRGYDALHFDPAQIEEIRVLAQQHPVVFLPSHKSNLDHPVLFLTLHEAGFPPSHTAGGINMNFFPVGSVARRAGIFFIRRTFKDNEVYKFVLRSYIDFLVEKRFPLEWFIEGGRSRSGKLLPPRYGMMSYVVDSYRRGKSEDVILIPVSVAYDQISEVAEYAREQRGGSKQAEGLGWLIRFLHGLGRHYGSIDLRFGEPLSLRAALGPPDGGIAESIEQDLTVPKLSFEVCARINRVTPITPISLAMLALLGVGDRAMSLSEIQSALSDLVDYVARRGLPTTSKIAFETKESVRNTLAPLVESGILSCFDEGAEVIYSIAPGQHLCGAYYRNTVIHFLMNSAIVELALLRVAESRESEGAEVFWREALRLRDVLKFDFFFSEKEEFRREITIELALVSRDWQAFIEDPRSARDFLEEIRPFHAHRTLRAFFEAYALVADRLEALGDERAEDEKQLLRDCMVWGKQYTLQRRIRSAESVSKTLLQNGIRLASNHGLLDADSSELRDRRAAFADEIRESIRRINAIDALASARRAGAIA